MGIFLKRYVRSLLDTLYKCSSYSAVDVKLQLCMDAYVSEKKNVLLHAGNCGVQYAKYNAFLPQLQKHLPDMGIRYLPSETLRSKVIIKVSLWVVLVR